LRVPPHSTERVMREARERGVYDETRSVRLNGGKVEVPVEEPYGDYTAVCQNSPKRRRVSLESFVDDPPSYRLVGDVALVEFGERGARERAEVAEALEEIHDTRAVLDDRGIEGEERVPDVRHVAGDDNTETVHHENGFEFALDPARVMFSTGNAEERVLMRETVSEGEKVLDMFAGIGYFAVPLAVGGADVVAVEKRRVAYDYLVENGERNGVEDSLDARHGDSREVSLNGEVDRVVMGHFDATGRAYLQSGLEAVGDEGLLHVHDAVHAENEDETLRRVESVAEDEGYETETGLREVKSYSEGVAHVVVDASVSL